MTSIRSLTDQLPAGDDLLRTIGLQMRRDDSSIFSSLAIFAAGLAIGAGVAYFVTNELSANGASEHDEPSVGSSVAS